MQQWETFGDVSFLERNYFRYARLSKEALQLPHKSANIGA
jgi:hypothetical protein